MPLNTITREHIEHTLHTAARAGYHTALCNKQVMDTLQIPYAETFRKIKINGINLWEDQYLPANQHLHFMPKNMPDSSTATSAML